MKEQFNQQFSVGRRVLVCVVTIHGTVKSLEEASRIIGEFVHEVLVDGEQEAWRIVGCDIHGRNCVRWMHTSVEGCLIHIVPIRSATFRPPQNPSEYGWQAAKIQENA